MFTVVHNIHLRVNLKFLHVVAFFHTFEKPSLYWMVYLEIGLWLSAPRLHCNVTLLSVLFITRIPPGGPGAPGAWTIIITNQLKVGLLSKEQQDGRLKQCLEKKKSHSHPVFSLVLLLHLSHPLQHKNLIEKPDCIPNPQSRKSDGNDFFRVMNMRQLKRLDSQSGTAFRKQQKSVECQRYISRLTDTSFNTVILH